MRSAVRMAIIVVVTVVVVVGAMWLLQRRLIYLPSQAVPAVPSALPGAEEVSFVTADGLTLQAWFLPADGPPAATVILFNGNAGNRAGRAPLAESLAIRGLAVLLTDYRGYGGNPGSPTESGLAADARAARAYLESRSDVDAERIVYFGESLGSAVAIELAVTHPPAALVLRSPFTSLPDVASVHYGLLPVSWLLWDRYESLNRIPGIDVPVLVVAGTDDEIVPYEQSVRLYEAAPGVKELVTLEGVRHNDFALGAGEEMVSRVVDFVRRVLGGAA